MISIQNIIVFFSLAIFLSILNYLIKRFNIFIHLNSKETHKKFGVNNIPLSGGLFFFSIFLYIYPDQNFLDYSSLILLFFYLLLGLVVDSNVEINPKLRLFIQIILTLILVLFTNVFVNETNLFYLDYFLENFYFKIFFSCFCILVVLNGLNFMDGVNNNVVGFVLLALISIYVINSSNSNLIHSKFYIFFITTLIVFYIYNFFSKNYLGDSGIYILSISLSIIVISFVNNSEYLSPLIAINLLWYPAIETLFSITRKIKKNKNPFEPDTNHLHTQLMKYLNLNKVKYANSLSGFFINLFLIPNFLIAIYFYNNSKIMVINSVLYIALYLIIYVIINNFLKKKL